MIQTAPAASKTFPIGVLRVENAKKVRLEEGEDLATAVFDGSGMFTVTALGHHKSGANVDFYGVRITATNPPIGKGYANWSNESLTVFARELLARDYTK